MTLRISTAQAVGRIPFLRLGIRRRLVEWLAPRGSLGTGAFESAHFAGRYRGERGNAQDWHVLFFGGYELKELALLTDLTKALDQPTVMDVGANQGGHSLTLARHAKQVHSFEPFPPLADQVEALMAHNSLSNVRVHRVGLGSEAATLDYYLDTEADNQGTGSFLAEHTGSGVAAKLPVVRGDDHFAGKLDALDLIKIDIEGFEAPALVGLRQILARFEPMIVMEVTESSSTLFAQHGGIETVLPFAFDVWKVANPAYPLGIFQSGAYRLEQLDAIEPRRNSYNILVMPRSRRAVLKTITG